MNAVYKLYFKDDKLQLSIEEKEVKGKSSFDNDHLSYGYMSLRFERKDELIVGFELDSGRVKNLEFEKLE